MNYEQINLFDSWQYDKDNDQLLCRCPKCQGRLIIHVYLYWNPYKYCPYCGIKLQPGKLRQARKRVYKFENEPTEEELYKLLDT